MLFRKFAAVIAAIAVASGTLMARFDPSAGASYAGRQAHQWTSHSGRC
jgi:hypothetical protein